MRLIKLTDFWKFLSKVYCVIFYGATQQTKLRILGWATKIGHVPIFTVGSKQADF